MRRTTNPIRIAIIGIGNCASSLVQGISFYRRHPRDEVGIITPLIGGKRVTDISVVAAFDIDDRKVGRPLSKGIFAAPNNARRLVGDIPATDVVIQMGHVLDGCAPHLASYPPTQRIQLSRRRELSTDEVVDVLLDTKTDVLVNYLPVGSQRATEFYAECALKSGVAFLNCIPVFLASHPGWARKFARRGIPLIGDDIKAQVGATIVHRALARVCTTRGARITHSYQLNTGGNTDFLSFFDVCNG